MAMPHMPMNLILKPTFSLQFKESTANAYSISQESISETGCPREEYHTGGPAGTAKP